jgi:hypothetical protein
MWISVCRVLRFHIVWEMKGKDFKAVDPASKAGENVHM